MPQISDAVAAWLPARAARALQAAGMATLAELTLRVPRRRRWWTAVPDVGPASARHIEAFFVAHPALTARARALVVAAPSSSVAPWELLRVPAALDGAAGQFRAPAASCILGVDHDYDAVQAWLALHETPATRKAYRKEAERLLLWAIVAHGKALSSLTTRDATDYRAFPRAPSPQARWIGPAAAAQRLRFLLDFGYATGLRIRELTASTLHDVATDPAGNHWLQVICKGHKQSRVTLTPLAMVALERHLLERGLPVCREHWDPCTPLIGRVAGHATARSSARAMAGSTASARVRMREKRSASRRCARGKSCGASSGWPRTAWKPIPPLAAKLRCATPHWMRHTHATHALARGVELSAVRDNLRHASISTTSIYLHADDARRAAQFRGAFAGTGTDAPT